MPTLHRLSCLRDDLIFVIYLYQRWAYGVDHSRPNEYGQVEGGTENNTEGEGERAPALGGGQGDGGPERDTEEEGEHAAAPDRRPAEGWHSVARGA
jgi:hypothetical protein